MSRIVGIDLGTTNSLVAYVDEKTGVPRVIPDRDGQALLPSVVSFVSEGVLVGAVAKRQLVRRPESTVYSVKRLMGRGYEDVKEELCYLPFKVLPCEGIVKILIGSHEVTPPEVSAIVLKALKERAEAHFGESIEKAVITVPAYFNDSQRQATKDAGRIAGLDVVRIVNEPTAASLAYGLERIREGVVAVYDLGGGTFDISILRVKDGVFEVLATNGNTHLGGDDFDRAIVMWLLDDIREKHGVYLGRDPEAMQELRLAARSRGPSSSGSSNGSWTPPFPRAGWPSPTPGWRRRTSTRWCWSEARRAFPSCGGGCRSCSARPRTASSIPTRSSRWARRSRRTFSRAASRTCCCST